MKLVSGRWAEKPWAASIALAASSTLDDLHDAIQQAVDFDNDHLYEFVVARTPWARDRVRYDEEEDAVFTTTLESLYPLPKNRRLFYMFDYGDSWYFEITRARKQPYAPEPGVEYPKSIGETGEKPRQYPDPDFSICFQPG